MTFDVAVCLNVLERTPGTLRALLSDLPDELVSGNEGAKTWSPYDVVGHLIHGERTDWIPRIEVILSATEGRRFVPFDRFAQFRESGGRTLDVLLDEFAGLRASNLARLRALDLSDTQLDRTATHPELGTVTLRELLATWTVHDLDHIVQIARVMARQFADQVGPWRAYLRVVREPAP